MRGAPSPEQSRRGWGAFKRPIMAHSFWMRLANCRLNFSPSYCAQFKNGKSNGWGVRLRPESMYG